VVGANDSEPFASKQRQVLEHSLAEHSVRLHELPFAVVESRRLAQNAVGDADLADVVQKESVFHAAVIEQFRRDLVGQLERVTLHALRVGAGAAVLGLERPRQRRHRLGVGALQKCALTPLELDQPS